MKDTIREEILNFRRLIGEATDTSNSGSYEQPMGFDMDRPTTICPNTGQPLVGTEVRPNAPTVNVVDITMNQPTSYEGNMNTNQPAFEDMPYLSTHPSGWSFDGDEEDFLSKQGIQRPTVSKDEEIMGSNFDEMDNGYVDEDEEIMSANFDEMDDDDDDDDDVFNTLDMFTETKKGLGWR